MNSHLPFYSTLIVYKDSHFCLLYRGIHVSASRFPLGKIKH